MINTLPVYVRYLKAEKDKVLQFLAEQGFFRPSGGSGNAQGQPALDAETETTFIVTGRIPKGAFADFQKSLSERFPGILVAEDPGPEGPRQTPCRWKANVKVKDLGARWSEPYRRLTHALGVPTLEAVDPAPWISLTYPLFFGFVVGDLGYGLALLALALWGLSGFRCGPQGLKRMAESPIAEALLRILMQGALASVGFGILFGEVFGLGLRQLGLPLPLSGPWPLHRLENPQILLVLSIGLGVAHTVIGLCLGVVAAVRGCRNSDASAPTPASKARRVLATKVGLLCLLAALGPLGVWLNSGGGLPLLAAAAALGGVALLLLGYGSGALALLEALGLVTHLSSYVRLMGFGVAGAQLTALLNTTLADLGSSLVIGMILTTLLAVLLHALNGALHVFEAGLQALRLHLVEFHKAYGIL